MIVLLYNSLEEKKDILGLTNEEIDILGDKLIDKIIYKVSRPIVEIVGASSTNSYICVSMFLPIELREDEYILFHEIVHKGIVRGYRMNLGEIKVMFPDFYTFVCREDIINDIIS